MTPFDTLLYSMRTDKFEGPSPYYRFVPKEPRANKQFRIDALKAGQRSKKAAEALWIICKRDILFYVNTMCFVFEPRSKEVLPFITYDYQDKAIEMLRGQITLAASKEIARCDVVIEKSRDMGATWICCTVLEHSWHFDDNFTALLLSRKEDLVDSSGSGDPKSLFAKVDFLHAHQPGWLLPDTERLSMHLANRDNGSSLDGESTNKFAGVADRRAAVLLDEFSKMDGQGAIAAGLQQTTKCRIFNFTPNGSGNESYSVAHNPKFKKLTLHWSLHPDKAKGMYRDSVTGKLRSPWYDNECDRANHPMEIAQELDIDYLGSAVSWFGQAFLDEQEKTYARPPSFVGDLDYERGTAIPVGFVGNNTGLWQMWCPLDLAGKPPREAEYVIGCDIAYGTGATPSTLCVAERSSGEVVAEYSDSNIKPEKFAELATAACHSFNGAYLIWEANGGAGRNFGDTVWELGYRNIYYRVNEKSVGRARTDMPGWWSSSESKLALLGEYRRNLGVKFINRSADTMREQRLWVFVPGKEVDREGTAMTPEGSDAHGDRVIAQALTCHGLLDRPLGRRVPDEKEKTTVNSIGGRREERKRIEEAEALY